MSDHRVWLRDTAAEIIGVPATELGTDTPLTDHGLSSVGGSALCAAVEDTFDVPCDLAVLGAAPTVDALADWLRDVTRA